MPIRVLLNAFTPEDANVIIQAFAQTLKDLQLANRDDPATLLVAERIIEVAKKSERDPQRLRSTVLASFGVTATKSLQEEKGNRVRGRVDFHR
jgi:hypothetical protein